MDRGVVGANAVNGERRSDRDHKGAGLQGELDLSNVEDGLLSSVYMVGRLIGSPLFSQSVRYFDLFRIIGTGTILWIIGVVATGLAPGFVQLVIARWLVGLGGSSVLVLAPSIIDDKAPRNRRSLWMALCTMQGPLGLAAGYAVGAGMEMALGWRSAFFAVAALMIPCTILCFLIGPISLNRGHAHDAAWAADDSTLGLSALSQLRILWEDSRTILSHLVYDLSIVGNAVYVGVGGTIVFWQAKAIHAIFRENETDVWLGGAMILSTILGTLIGGLLLDTMGSTIRKALLLSSIANAAVGIVLLPSYLFVKAFYLFLPLLFIGTSFMTVQMAPMASVILWSVPLHLRPLSMSFLLISMHLLGDIPSPTLFGQHLQILEDRLDQSEDRAYRIAIAVAVAFLFICAGIYALGIVVAKNATDYRLDREASIENGRVENDDREPLLQRTL